MALDRSWYNTLVDDDGSGLTGSIWDKGDVNALMNTIDSELARLDTGSGWVSFTPQLYAVAGVWSATNPLTRWRRDGTTGKSLTLLFSIEGGTLSAATGSIAMQLPAPAGPWAGIPTNTCVLFVPALEMGSVSIPTSKTVIEIYRNGAVTFPAGSITVRGQVTYELP